MWKTHQTGHSIFLKEWKVDDERLQDTAKIGGRCLADEAWPEFGHVPGRQAHEVLCGCSRE